MIGHVLGKWLNSVAAFRDFPLELFGEFWGVFLGTAHFQTYKSYKYDLNDLGPQCLENQNPKNSSGQRNLRYFGQKSENIGVWSKTSGLILNPYPTRSWPVPNSYLSRTWVKILRLLSQKLGYCWNPKIAAGFSSEGTKSYSDIFSFWIHFGWYPHPSLYRDIL